MLPLNHWEYLITERQIELQKLLKQQRLLQCLGSARKQSRPKRFIQTILSVVRLPVEVLRRVHVLQRKRSVSNKKHSPGVCETQLS